MNVIHHPHIEATPRGATIAGSRVLVRRLWAWHKGGASVRALLQRYSDLGPAKVLSALAFEFDNRELLEAELVHEREMRVRRAVLEEAST